MKLLLFIDYTNIVKILLQTTQIGLHLANYKFWYEFKKWSAHINSILGMSTFLEFRALLC